MKKIKFILRAAWAVLTASIYQVLTLPLDLLGAVVVPVAILFGVRRPSRITGREIFTAPQWLYLWGNEQDGYDPEWAVNSIYKGWPVFLRRYSWAAWRNKSSNKRFTFVSWLHQPPDPARIEYINPSPGTWVCWQGWRTNWQWVRKDGAWTEIGWRYQPSDKGFTDPGDWRQFGCGVAFRLNGKS